MGNFENQVAIVTGGATGIGGATARTLASRGAKVLIADIDEETAATNVQSILDANGTAAAVRVDVSKAEDSRRMVREAVDRWGRIDILVQNAFGVATMPAGFQGGAEDVEEDAWEYGISVLAKALYLGAKYTVPVMREGGGGAIVNLASVHSLLQAPGWLIYESGKAAVVGMTRQMAAEYGPDGIRVNCVCPGHIVTEGLAEMWKSNPEGLAFYGDMYPLRRTGDAGRHRQSHRVPVFRRRVVHNGTYPCRRRWTHNTDPGGLWRPDGRVRKNTSRHGPFPPLLTALGRKRRHSRSW